MPDGFFQGRRLAVYCKGGHLTIDRKTEKRSWRLKLALTLTDEDAHAAGGAILSNYRQIQTRSNAVERIELGGGFNLIAQFYADAMQGGKLLRLDKCYIDEFAMTYEDEQTELWIRLEHENTDKLHAFVKDYAFSRFAVQFTMQQRTIAEAIDQDMEEKKRRLQEAADETGVTTSLFDPDGKKLAEFKPRGKAN